jgi:Ca-activated chloride channel family protein
MRWENPIWLFALWVLPLLAAVLVYAHRRRAAAARRFAELAMLGRLLPPPGTARAWLKGSLLLVGVALLIVAAARPRFGVYFEQVSARGVDLFVLLDVSRSMLAEDVAPHRLERAKSDIRDLLRKLPGDRIGLIAFAGAPAVIVPLTTDRGFFLNALDRVDTRSAPRGGSLIGDAIRKAIESLDATRDRDQVLVLITDGEDHDSFPLEAAQSAAEREIKIFAVGLGDTEEGRRIPLRDPSGSVRYLQHEGQEIWSRMDERLLKEIALKTSGAYIPARTRTYDLGQIYEEHLAGLARGEIQAEKRKRYAERFQGFVFFGLAALLAEMLVASYPRAIPAAAPADESPPRTGRASRLRRAAAPTAALLLCLAAPGFATAGVRDAVRHVDEGIQQFRRGEYAAAGRHFAEADVALPDHPRIAFDRACAAAAAGETERAVELFQQAALARDEHVAAEAHYNLGCVAAAQAKALFGPEPETATPDVRQQGLQRLAQAVAHYRDCLRVRDNHDAARHNLELLRQWIKHMQQVWAERDRQQRREELDLLQMLEMITAEQTSLRQAVQAAAREDDSPRRRQAATQSGEQQRQLAEEIEPLKDKIRETLAAPPAPQTPPGGATAPAPQTPNADADPEAEQAIELLHGFADRAQQGMTQAAERLADQELAAAAETQQQALDALEDIYLAVAPFPQFLAATTARQQTLVERSQQLVENADEKKAPPAAAEDQAVGPPDFEALAQEQNLIRRRSEVLPLRAEQELKQLPAPVAGPAPPPQQPPPQPPSQAEPAEPQPPDLRPALEKAVELGPKIPPLTQQAAEDLQKQQPDAALPNQQAALELFREIADLLPKQPPQQGQSPDQQQDPNDPSQQPQNQQSQSGENPPQPQNLSQQQAEALMRKVRERERQYREKQQELQQFRRGATAVDKDW